MRKLAIAIFIIIASALSSVVLADDLSDIYKQALINDQTFKSAEAQFLANKELLPISRAALLPSIVATGSVGRHYQNNRTNRYDSFSGYGLSLTQTVFNYTSWAAVQNASALVKQAEAQYFAAAQDLMLRTATAYLNILAARDYLKFTQAHKKSLERRLKEEKKRYEVGLIPITNVYQIKALYDKTSSDEIAAENDLANKIEKLRAIIGKDPGTLAILRPNLPLYQPNPANVSQWMTVAEKQNYNLLATQYAAIAARDNIKMQFGGHLPTVSASGSYSYTNTTNPTPNISNSNSIKDKTALLSLNLSLPVYEGGLTSAEVRQANDQYQQASADKEFQHRQVIMQTRQAYLGVVDTISKMHADNQAIISNQGSLKAMEAGYHFGTRIMTDVLDQETSLYQSENDYSQDQYNYIIQTLSLKQAAGTLSANDLMMINSWLRVGSVLDENLRISNISAKDTTLNIEDLDKVVEQPKVTVPKRLKESKKTVSVKKGKIKPQDQSVSSKPGNNVLALNPNHYVIQIFAGNSERSIVNFMQKHANAAKMMYFGTQNGDEKIYKLIIGDYPSLTAAQTAKAILAKQWRVNGLWVRNISSVQGEIRN